MLIVPTAIRAALLLALSLLCPATASAAPLLPHHRMTVSLDLDKGQIRGSVEITMPQEVNTIGVGKNLRLRSLLLNGKSLVPTTGNGRVTLPPHPEGSILLMEYEGVFRDGGDPDPKNMVNREGAFLTGDWYPAAEAPLSRFSLSVYVPSGFHALSEADAIELAHSGQRNLVTFDFPHPVPSVHLVVAPYVSRASDSAPSRLPPTSSPRIRGLRSSTLPTPESISRCMRRCWGPIPSVALPWWKTSSPLDTVCRPSPFSVGR